MEETRWRSRYHPYIHFLAQQRSSSIIQQFINNPQHLYDDTSRKHRFPRKREATEILRELIDRLEILAQENIREKDQEEEAQISTQETNQEPRPSSG